MNHPVTLKQFPIFIRQANGEIPANRFDGDFYEREELANRLTEMLDRLPEGAVLSIDSAWGEGKTWFGRRWNASLNDLGYRTIYIDCFQRDHIDDPFSMLAGEFLALSKQSEPEIRTKLLNTSKKIGASLLPVATKLAISAAGHWLMGEADIGKVISKAAEKATENVLESGSENIEKFVGKSLEDYQADKETVEGFKNALRELAEKSEKPMIIFIDELDRCRPDFAVRTIERVKHFFDVPGIIFVLLINRKQLVAAIRGLYGQDVEADAYLGKFVQLALTLPKRVSTELHSPDDNRKHCEMTLQKFGYQYSDAIQQFSQVFGVLAALMNLSLRDTERAVILFSFAHPISTSAIYVAWPIALKLAKPDLFARLLVNDRGAHYEVYQLILSMRPKYPQNLDHVILLLEEMHRSGADGFTTEPSPEVMKNINHMRIRGIQNFFTLLFSRFDLTVSR